MTAAKKRKLPKSWASKPNQRDEHLDAVGKGLQRVFPELAGPPLHYAPLSYSERGTKPTNKLLPPELDYAVRTVRSISHEAPITFAELARFAGFRAAHGTSDAANNDPLSPSLRSSDRSVALRVLAGGIDCFPDAGEIRRWQPTNAPDDLTDVRDRGRRILVDILHGLSSAKSLAAGHIPSNDPSSNEYLEVIDNMFSRFTITDEEARRSFTNLRSIATDHKHGAKYLNVVGTITSTVLNTVSVLMTNVQNFMPYSKNKGRSTKAAPPSCEPEDAITLDDETNTEDYVLNIQRTGRLYLVAFLTLSPGILFTPDSVYAVDCGWGWPAIRWTAHWLSTSGANTLPPEHLELERLGRLIIRYASILSFSIDDDDVFRNLFKAACSEFVVLAAALAHEFERRTGGDVKSLGDIMKNKRKRAADDDGMRDDVDRSRELDLYARLNTLSAGSSSEVVFGQIVDSLMIGEDEPREAYRTASPETFDISAGHDRTLSPVLSGVAGGSSQDLVYQPHASSSREPAHPTGLLAHTTNSDMFSSIPELAGLIPGSHPDVQSISPGAVEAAIGCGTLLSEPAPSVGILVGIGAHSVGGLVDHSAPGPEHSPTGHQPDGLLHGRAGLPTHDFITAWRGPDPFLALGSQPPHAQHGDPSHQHIGALQTYDSAPPLSEAAHFAPTGLPQEITPGLLCNDVSSAPCFGPASLLPGTSADMEFITAFSNYLPDRQFMSESDLRQLFTSGVSALGNVFPAVDYNLGAALTNRTVSPAVFAEQSGFDTLTAPPVNGLPWSMDGLDLGSESQLPVPTGHDDSAAKDNEMEDQQADGDREYARRDDVSTRSKRPRRRSPAGARTGARAGVDSTAAVRRPRRRSERAGNKARPETDSSTAITQVSSGSAPSLSSLTGHLFPVRNPPPSDWTRNREPAYLDITAIGESVTVYGREEKEWIRAHCNAGLSLVNSNTKTIQVFTPRIQLWDTPRSAWERRHIRKISNQVQRAATKVIVIRAPPPAPSLDPTGDESSDDEPQSESFPSELGAMGDFLVGQYGRDALVEVQVPDIYREHDEVAPKDRADGTENIVVMSILEFVERSRNLASGGLNFLAGKNSAPSRPAEWWRGCTCNIAVDHDGTVGEVSPEVRSMPTTPWNFTVAGHRGTHTMDHIDASGSGTIVFVEQGEKLWFIKTPISPLVDDFRDVPLENFTLEVVRLKKGDTLIMPPGTIHAVLTTEDSVVTGGHFLCNETIERTLLTAMKLAGSLKTATNAEMNGPMLCAFDRHCLRHIQCVSEHLRQFQTTGPDSVSEPHILDVELLDFATSDWMVGLLFADSFFPRKADDASETLGDLEAQHGRVLERASLFLRWVGHIRPDIDVGGAIARRLVWFFTTAAEECELDDMMDFDTALQILQLKYAVSVNA